ncbi:MULTISPECIES: hypothetical protein [Photorhabdus]|uniref:Uncharacterized protein n=1 Tax=Photorhabdus thracensis TaxID=230089 RepID=A0A0F7LNM5_9GAMM|nr:hypothetical protein [Photorhabdus thracensis]AKH63446.1 hypothetical protein VY86_08920 [Photorhabdus thracensis]MCC8420222.1 hypothetical protein [Photorhabdus thracensis]
MAFKSQLQKSKASSRRGSSASIVVSQTYKQSTNSQELSVRISSDILDKIETTIGGKVDVLYDQEEDLWMVKPYGDNGFSISGKKGAATGLVRYTLKKGHARFTEDQTLLPIKRECDEDSLLYEDGGVIFKLVIEDEKM